MDNLKPIIESINQKKLDLALKQCEDYNIKENKYIINNFIGVIYSFERYHIKAASSIIITASSIFESKHF